MKYTIAFLFLTFLFGCKHRPSRLRYAIYGVADSISRGFDSVQVFYGDFDSENYNGSVRFNYCYGNNYLKMDSAEEAKYQFMYIKIDSIARIQMKTGHYWVMHDSWFGEDSSNIHLNDYHIVISKSKSLDTVKNFSTPSTKHKAIANKKVASTYDGLITGSYMLQVDSISGDEAYYYGASCKVLNVIDGDLGDGSDTSDATEAIQKSIAQAHRAQTTADCRKRLPLGLILFKSKTVHDKWFLEECDEQYSTIPGQFLGKYKGKWSFANGNAPVAFSDSCSAKAAFRAYQLQKSNNQQ